MQHLETSFPRNRGRSPHACRDKDNHQSKKTSPDVRYKHVSREKDLGAMSYHQFADERLVSKQKQSNNQGQPLRRSKIEEVPKRETSGRKEHERPKYTHGSKSNARRARLADEPRTSSSKEVPVVEADMTRKIHEKPNYTHGSQSNAVRAKLSSSNKEVAMTEADMIIMLRDTESDDVIQSILTPECGFLQRFTEPDIVSSMMELMLNISRAHRWALLSLWQPRCN